MPIALNTRAELIVALNEAAELEHGLLCQYLFAAFSVKSPPHDADLNPRQVELVREWKGNLLWVAVEEMAHLGTVCNLLSAIGSVPHLDRPPFPQPARFFPNVQNGELSFVPFTLEKLSPATLARLIRFESPEAELAAFARPVDLRYRTVGDLYQQIRDGMQAIPEDALFIGPHGQQDMDDWGAMLRLYNAGDRASALRAIDAIVLDGEGAPQQRTDSHYATFVRMQEQWQAELTLDPDFVPTRPVVSNPLICGTADDGPYCINHAVARPLAGFFNDIYSTALLMLVRYYSFAGESEIIRRVLRSSIRQLMSAILRPVGDMLTTYPARADGGVERAGPGFEIESPPRLPIDRAAAWQVVLERLRAGVESLGQLRKQLPDIERLTHLHENLFTLTDTLSRLPF